MALPGSPWVTGPALAAEGAKGGASEVIFLAQLITLMLVGRLLGEAMNRIGQPSIMGMLLGGILLGPSALGALLPDLQHALFPKTPEQKAILERAFAPKPPPPRPPKPIPVLRRLKDLVRL